MRAARRSCEWRGEDRLYRPSIRSVCRQRGQLIDYLKLLLR